jgi:hypothetical protein
VAGQSLPFNPNVVVECRVYTNAIREDSPSTTDQTTVDPPDANAQKKTTGHEIGHGIGIDHYVWTGSGTLTVMVSGFDGWADPIWSNIPVEYSADDEAQLRLK